MTATLAPVPAEPRIPRDEAKPEPSTGAPSTVAPPGDVVLRCAGLRKRFGERQAVDGVGLRSPAARRTACSARTAPGKTTTISMICGILARDAGEIVVDGHADGPRRDRA